MRFGTIITGLIWAGLSAFGASAAELAVVARPGPWPVADHLIAYNGQIWFSTAVKGVDHNSADVWRFDPATQSATFERYLFSQDTGRPAVHAGLLYWPHEDMRIGLGTGVASVTNGEEWRDLFVSTDDYMMHTHAVASWRDGLVVAMAGWHAVLARSDDAGRSWQTLVNDQPQSGSFHRYNDVVAVNDRLFVRHWQDTGLMLSEYRDGRVVPVEGWPQGRFFHSLTPFAGALYGLVDGEEGVSELWRVAGGGKPVRIDTEPKDFSAGLLLSDGKTLWAATRDGQGGQLWASADGERFSAGDQFLGGIPVSAAALKPGKIYIGGAGFDGKAIVWGPADRDVAQKSKPAELPIYRDRADWPFDAAAEHARLSVAFGDPQNFQRHGRRLRELLGEVTVGKPPAGFLAALLEADMPDQQVEVFGGQFSVSARDIGTWHILAAMARVGDATVPVRFLAADWTGRENRPQKWFDGLLIGMHAVQLSGQNDRATVDALIRRLDDAKDPDWLASQVTGTLSAITGMPFAHDTSAWRAWWAQARETWPADAI